LNAFYEELRASTLFNRTNANTTQPIPIPKGPPPTITNNRTLGMMSNTTPRGNAVIPSNSSVRSNSSMRSNNSLQFPISPFGETLEENPVEQTLEENPVEQTLNNPVGQLGGKPKSKSKSSSKKPKAKKPKTKTKAKKAPKKK
jgi:hypothetical protein